MGAGRAKQPDVGRSVSQEEPIGPPALRPRGRCISIKGLYTVTFPSESKWVHGNRKNCKYMFTIPRRSLKPFY